jgi:hypothetical protein
MTVTARSSLPMGQFSHSLLPWSLVIIIEPKAEEKFSKSCMLLLHSLQKDVHNNLSSHIISGLG